MASSIPLWVLWVNGVVLLILITTFIFIILSCRKENTPDYHMPYLVFGIISTISLLAVNIPSFFNHYLVYFVDERPTSDAATWLRFVDRYSMVFVAIINDIRVQKKIIKWFTKNNKEA